MREYLFSYLPIAVGAFLVALIGVALFVPRLRRFALRIGAVQDGGKPHGRGLRLHSGKVPNIGGIAIFAGFIVALLVGSVIDSLSGRHLLEPYRVQLLAIVLGAALMTLVGFIDDLWEVPPVMRLGTQFVAAGILVVNGVKIDFITNFLGDTPYIFFGEPLAIIVTIVWVVGFTNAFNFIDGLDGLSSGMATIASLSLLAVALQFDDRGAAVLLLAALAGAALGFLRHNFNPATIIMGDSGAYLLGYTLAAVSVLGALKVTAAVTVAAPIFILALPVVNITQVTLRRLWRGVNPTIAANDHLHDMIRERSGSKRLTVLILWLVTLLLGVMGMMISRTPPELMYLTIAATVLLIAGVSLMRLRDAARESPAA